MRAETTKSLKRPIHPLHARRHSRRRAVQSEHDVSAHHAETSTLRSQPPSQLLTAGPHHPSMARTKVLTTQTCLRPTPVTRHPPADLIVCRLRRCRGQHGVCDPQRAMATMWPFHRLYRGTTRGASVRRARAFTTIRAETTKSSSPQPIRCRPGLSLGDVAGDSDARCSRGTTSMRTALSRRDGALRRHRSCSPPVHNIEGAHGGPQDADRPGIRRDLRRRRGEHDAHDGAVEREPLEKQAFPAAKSRYVRPSASTRTASGRIRSAWQLDDQDASDCDSLSFVDQGHQRGGAIGGRWTSTAARWRLYEVGSRRTGHAPDERAREDFTAATRLLEPLLAQPDPTHELRSAVGRIYLQAGQLAAAERHFAAVARDTAVPQPLKDLNAAFLA
ncbi:hypothetical protein FA95DRAFT_1618523, partial [Auriscalpium vulgare]